MKEKKKSVVPANGAKAVLWGNLDKIKKVLAPKLSNEHFHIFYQFGVAQGADPWLKEVIPILFKNDRGGHDLALVLTRDFRVKVAHRQPDYEWHYSQCVYSDDPSPQYNPVTGEFNQEPIDFNSPRGELVGAFCLVKKKGVDRLFYLYRKFNEYKKNNHMWKDMPDTMMGKVPESHLLKKEWPETFNNTFDESELPIPQNGVIDIPYDDTEKKTYPDEPPSLTEPTEPPVTEVEHKERKSKQEPAVDNKGKAYGNGQGNSTQRKLI